MLAVDPHSLHLMSLDAVRIEVSWSEILEKIRVFDPVEEDRHLPVEEGKTIAWRKSSLVYARRRLRGISAPAK